MVTLPVKRERRSWPSVPRASQGLNTSRRLPRLRHKHGSTIIFAMRQCLFLMLILAVLAAACSSPTVTRGGRNVSTGMRQLIVQFTVDSPRSLAAEPSVG